MTSRFLTSLVVDDTNGFPVRLVQPLVYASERLSWVIHVHAGFKTDFSSIPRILWTIIPKEGLWNRPGVVHDWLYVRGQATRAEADAVFYEACRVCGVSASLSYTLWLGVRAGGWAPWRKYRKQ